VTWAPWSVLEYILTGDRFQGYAAHLNAVDRTAARSLLENQHGQLKTTAHHVHRGGLWRADAAAT
jgi:hypothetical protein